MSKHLFLARFGHPRDIDKNLEDEEWYVREAAMKLNRKEIFK